jgi:hypothetical protein
VVLVEYVYVFLIFPELVPEGLFGVFGGRFDCGCVVKVYHRMVYSPLPVESVAFTHTLYVVAEARPERLSDFVPLVTWDPLFVCPLEHCIVQEKRSPSGSLIGILQVRLNGFPVDPFAGDGDPNTGGRLALVVKVYHLLV